MFNYLQTGPAVEKISLDNQREVIAINFQNLIEAVGYKITSSVWAVKSQGVMTALISIFT